MAALGVSPGSAAAAELPTVSSVTGSVTIVDAQGRRTGAFAGLEIPVGATVETGRGAEASIVLSDGSEVKIRQKSKMKFAPRPRGSVKQAVNLFFGSLWAKIAKSASAGEIKFEVRTPTAVAGVRGTEINLGFGGFQLLVQVDTGSAAVESLVTGKTQGLEGGQESKITIEGTITQPTSISTDMSTFLVAAEAYATSSPDAAQRIATVQRKVAEQLQSKAAETEVALKEALETPKSERTPEQKAEIERLQGEAEALRDSAEVLNEAADTHETAVGEAEAAGTLPAGTQEAVKSETDDAKDASASAARAANDARNAAAASTGDAPAPAPDVSTAAETPTADATIPTDDAIMDETVTDGAATGDDSLDDGVGDGVERTSSAPAEFEAVEDPTEGNLDSAPDSSAIAVEQQIDDGEVEPEEVTSEDAVQEDVTGEPETAEDSNEEQSQDNIIDTNTVCASPSGDPSCTSSP